MGNEEPLGNNNNGEEVGDPCTVTSCKVRLLGKKWESVYGE